MVEENKGAGEENYKCTPYLHNGRHFVMGHLLVLQ